METRTSGSEERAGEPGRPKGRHRAPARPLQDRRPQPAPKWAGVKDYASPNRNGWERMKWRVPTTFGATDQHGCCIDAQATMEGIS